jgi:hypothetical protein
MKEKESNLPIVVIVVGAVLGAVLGAGAAYLFARESAEAGKKPSVTPNDALKLGLTLIQVLQQVAGLAKQ